MSSRLQFFRPRDSRRAHKRYTVERVGRRGRLACITDRDTGRARTIAYSVFERRYVPV